jgi:hypothetical protein
LVALSTQIGQKRKNNNNLASKQANKQINQIKEKDYNCLP